jgi:hypothetical protein
MSETDREVIIEGVLDGLAQKGLMVVPAHLASEALQLQKAKQRLMRRSKLTPYEISKFKLLPGSPSLATVKNMISDGRIKAVEVITDGSGKRYVIRSAVERLNSFGL